MRGGIASAPVRNVGRKEHRAEVGHWVAKDHGVEVVRVLAGEMGADEARVTPSDVETASGLARGEAERVEEVRGRERRFD